MDGCDVSEVVSHMSERTVTMQCGHAANAVTEDGKPCCAICAGIDPGAERIADEPDLAGRMARCYWCEAERPSSQSLAFFKYRPDQETDSFYCGCKGWD